MDYNRTNSERSNARQSEDAASDDNVIVINMDDYDFTDNDHQDDISQQPKEENGDPDTSNINTNQELNMEADDSSVNEELKPSFTTSYKNEIDTSVIHDSVSGAANRIPCEQERILEEDSQSHGKSSNNDMVVKLDLNGIDLGENEENSSSNIKRDEGECKIMAKMTTNENLPLQHALTSNTSAMPMPPSPHTPNIDITSNLELLNIGQTQNEEVKNVLEPEVSFPKEDENLEDSDSSDDEMKINLLYDKEKNEYMIKEEFCSSDKSESAISLNIKRSKDRLPVQNACQAESTEIVYEDSASAENQDDLIKIPIPSEEPTPQKEESGNKISIPLKDNEVSNFEMENDKEDSASEENKILLNLGGDDSSAQNNENQILVHETDSPWKIKLTGNFPEMNFDDIDVTKYLPKSPEKSYPDEASSSHLENPNLIQINFDAENEDDYVIKIPNIEDSPDKQVQNSDMEDKFQIPVSPLPQSSDDGKISIPLIPPHKDKDQQESSIFRIPADFSTKTEEPWQGRKRDEKAKYKETTRPRSDTFGEESKIQQVVIQNSIRNYYKLDMQKVNLKVVLPQEPEESPVLQGQTIFMFNRKVEEDMNKDAIRKLSFNFHSKFLKITKISTAKRFRKRNENQKVVSTYHQRKGDLEYDFDKEGFQQFVSNCSRSINAQDSEHSSPNTRAFVKKPWIQEFEEELNLRFHQERGKGLVSAEKVLELDSGENLPQDLDIIVDFEINETFDSGLIFRETSDPSKKGWYIASAHRYFETHYWLPWIDTLRQKNKWRITLITDKENEVACSGDLEKIIEIEDSNERGYLYRVDNFTAAWKIGFFVGRNFTEHNNKYFSTQRKLDESISLMGHDGKLIDDIIDIFESYLNKDFPYEQIDLVFVPNLFYGEDNKRRVICYAGMCLLDERLICSNSTIDNREQVHFHLSYALASNYFGWFLQEESYLDFWMMEGIAQALANIHTRVRWGKILYKFNIMKKIEYLTERVKRGLEIYPLYTENTPHPSYVQYEDHYFVKSEIIMHILETRIQEHFSKLLRILIKDSVKSNFTLSTKTFMKKFRKICGFSPKFLYNWLYKTGAAEIKVSQNWNRKSNTIELEIEQQNIIVHHLERSNVINKKKEEGNLTRDNINNENYEYLSNLPDKKFKPPKRSYNLEASREGRRLFQDSIRLSLYETDGTIIKLEQHELELRDNKVKINLAFPLKSKVKRNNTTKKKDNIYGPALAQDNWLFQPSDNICSADGKFYKSDIFKTKNIECSLLWIRVDPDFRCIRNVRINQDEDAWHYQLLREKDIIGQYEAIHELKKWVTETAYEALKYVIETDEFFYKIREEALKAIVQMNTRAFNKFLSTERFMMKVYNKYEEKFMTSLYQNKFGKEDMKYRKSAIRYFFDQTLIKAVSNEKTFSSKLVLGDVLEYDLNKMNGYTSKDLNKWMLDILKTLYSDKLVFEDTYFVSNIISSLGNTMNMKYLSDTVNEIIRQAKVDLARSTNTLEANCGSYNMMILLSWINALTVLFSNLVILQKQLSLNKTHRQSLRQPNLSSKDRKTLNKRIQTDKENLHKVHKEIPLITCFITSLESNPVILTSLQAQLSIFRFKMVARFQQAGFLAAMYEVLSLINEEIEQSSIVKATGCLKVLKDYLEQRMFVTRDLDYLELLDYNSPRNNAIYEILWEMSTLDFVFSNQEFRQAISSLIWMLYREVKLGNVPLDPEWSDYDKIQVSTTKGDDRSNFDKMSQIARRRYGEHESEMMSDHYSISKSHNKRSKNIITLNTGMKQPSQTYSRFGESVHKSEYSCGASEAKRRKYADEGDYEDQNDNDDQIDLTDLEWQDACIKVLSKLEEYEESEDFRNPVTREEVGEEFWRAYCSIIDYHVDFTTIRYKVLEGECKGVSHFEKDMKTVFSNCKKFNEPRSEIYSCAVFCEKLFHKLLKPIKKKFGNGDQLRDHEIHLNIGGMNI